MEHPFLVEEYIPTQVQRAPAPSREFGPAITKPRSAAVLPPLPNLPPSEALLLTPADAQYTDYLPAANLRTQLAPALRAVCKTENAVAVMTDWVRSNNLSFAVRCGGHSYEGFSQSADVVIDLRGLQDITVDRSAGLVTVGAGVSLYDVYQELANIGYAFPAGSCPTVGIAGHALGGGYGLLARSHGLTCDNLQQVTLIDAQAGTLEATATSEPDLFWACRGGGGGSFGTATQFVLRIFPLGKVLVFGVSWLLSQSKAARVFSAWQGWAPNAPNTITSIMKVGPGGGGSISMRCIGQSIGSNSELSNELSGLVSVETPSKPLNIQTLGFLDSVKHFAGGLNYEPVYFKAKSDYVLGLLAPPAIAAMLAAVATIPVGGIALLCDAYGGAISDVAAADTAFPRRGGTQYCIQYFSSWLHPADTASHVANVTNVYAAMRPYLPGAAYVNYCDLGLQNFADAYWGANLPRLSAVKKTYDPDNLFHHLQSVPVDLKEAKNGGPTLQLGSTGPDVRRLQILFVMMKLLDYTGIDGNFGPQTQAAVKSFQQSSNLTADGVVGPATWNILPADPNTPRVSRGSTGGVVSALQKALTSYSSPNTPTDPGPIDGDFGPRTESAVRAYQTNRGITANGVVGDRTWWVPTAGATGTTLASLAGLVTV